MAMKGRDAAATKIFRRHLALAASGGHCVVCVFVCFLVSVLVHCEVEIRVF